MPGICGAVGFSESSDKPTILAEMMSRMKHYDWYIEQTYCNNNGNVALGRVSLGFVNKASQPAKNEEGSLFAVMEGEIYNYDELRRELRTGNHVFQGDSHAELLLHGYEQEGKQFLRRIHGMFVGAIWDTVNQRLILCNDRFGMKPLYFAQLPGKLLLGSEVKALLADAGLSRQINLRGLAQFFTFGHFLGEDTLLEAVQLLPPAGWLTYDASTESISIDRYWQVETTVGQEKCSETEILDRIDTAFKRAVDRRVQGTDHLGISLSGGLDARTILGAVDSDRPLTSVTMGMEGSIDHRSSERLARLANRPHHRYVLNRQFLADFEKHMRRMVHLTDGHYLSQCIVMPTLPFYRELGIEVLLRGHAGELMHMDKAYNFSMDSHALSLNSTGELESWLYSHLRTHMLDDTGGELFFSGIQKEMDSLARESLQNCLRQMERLQPLVHRIWQMFLFQRVRRETALSMVKFGSVVETRLPYLDNDLLEALLEAPPQMKMGDRIQAHILRHRMPAFLKIANSNTGAPMGAGPVTRFMAKARLKVLSKLRVPGFQPYERLGQWLREELRPFVEHVLLSPRCLERGVFNPNTVRAIVGRHLNGRSNHTFLLLALMTFELGQREFIDGEQFGDTKPTLASRPGDRSEMAMSGN